MGRNRTPAQELKLAGTFDRGYPRKDWYTTVPFAVTGDEGAADSKYLKRTQVAWHSFMKVKSVQGILSEEDLCMVTLMFDALDNLYRIQDQIDAFYKKPNLSALLADEDYRSQLKEMVQIRKNHETSVAFFACKFGMTPAERSKLTVPEKKDESPMLQLLNRAKA